MAKTELNGDKRITRRDSTYYEKAIKRLQELENAIESGELVRLPAPLGHELWEIEMPTQIHNGMKMTICTYKGATVKKSKYGLRLSNADMVGKYYFLTREQAEQYLEAKLKELEGKK